VSDFQESLFGAFGKRPPAPPPAPAAPEPEPEVKPDLWTAAEAQRIFDVNAPPAVKPPAPPPAGGTSGALDVQGAWGKPEARGG